VAGSPRWCAGPRGRGWADSAQVLDGARAGGGTDCDGIGGEGAADVAQGVAEDDEAVAGPVASVFGSSADDVRAVIEMVAEAAVEVVEVEG